MAVIDRLVARIPVLLVAVPLATLAWVAFDHGGDTDILPAGLPALVLLVAYLRAGGRR